MSATNRSVILALVPAMCQQWHRLAERVDWALETCATPRPVALDPPPMRYSSNTWNGASKEGALRALADAPWKRSVASDGS
jgi:hypothetical protein